MALALEAAAGRRRPAGILGRVDRIAVPQGSWAYPDPARLVADRVGATRATTHLVELGIPQQSLVNEALAAIAGGCVRGGRRGGRGGQAVGPGRRAGRPAGRRDRSRPGAVPDVIRRRDGPAAGAGGGGPPALGPGPAVRHDRERPAGRRGSDPGRAPGRDRRPVGPLQPGRPGPIPTPPSPRRWTPTWIGTPSPVNRPLAFPYNKWHSHPVDGQPGGGAGALLGRNGPPARCAHRPVGLPPGGAGVEPRRLAPARRSAPHAWPAMEVLGERPSAQRIGRPVAEVEHRRALQLLPGRGPGPAARARPAAPTGTPTVTGGMAFAGGPFNNFVLQSMVAVVPRPCGPIPAPSAW